MSHSNTDTSLGNQLRQVMKASYTKLSDDAKKQAEELSGMYQEQSKFQKGLSKDEKWKDFFTQKSDDEDLNAKMVAAATAISRSEDARPLLDTAKSAFEDIKSETAKLQKAEGNWSKTVDPSVLTPVFIRELETAKAQIKEIYDACEKAYSQASRALMTKQKEQKNKKAGEEFFGKLIARLSVVRKGYKEANDDLVPGVYPGELEELVTADEKTTGSYLWFEAQKAEMEAIENTVYPPPRTPVVVPPPTEEEKQWNAVKKDVQDKYKKFKTDAAKLTANWADLNKWHELRGPYMESALNTDVVKNTYFVMPNTYTIGGKVYAVASSETTGLSLKTPIPNKLLNGYAQNAISFIYHRPK